MSDFVGLPLEKKLNRRNLLTRLEMVERGNHSARPSLRADALAEVAGDLGSLLGSGWIFDADSITDAAGVVGMSSRVAFPGEDVRIFAGASDPEDPETAVFKVYDDGSLFASQAVIEGNISASVGQFGGWQIGATYFERVEAATQVGIRFDSATPSFLLGDLDGAHTIFDGANQNIRSSNYVAGASGSIWHTATGNVEFNNAIIRGELKTFLLSAQNRMVTAGAFGLSPDAGKVAAAIGSSDTTIDFGKSVTPGDWVRFQGPDAAGSNSLEWVLIGSLVSGTTYNVTRNVDGSGANDWSVDTPFEVIGAEGDSRIEMTSGASASIQLITQGATWDANTVQVSMSTADGKVLFGGGDGWLDQFGLTFANQEGFVQFLDTGGNGAILIYSDGFDDLVLKNQVGGAATGIRFDIDDASNNVVGPIFNADGLYYDGLNTDINLSVVAGTATEFNTGSIDIDFIVYSDTGAYLYGDAGLNKFTSFVWDGWGNRAEAWTRTGNHTFTVPGDVTAIYRKNAKVRYGDGGTDYGVIASSSHAAGTTTVNLIPNTDYAMAAATITDRYISYIENPEGFPKSFAYSLVINGSSGSAGTYAQTVNFGGRWSVSGGKISVAANIRVDNKGSWGGNVQASLPAAPTSDYSSAFQTALPSWYANAGLPSAPKALCRLANSTTLLFIDAFNSSFFTWTELATNDWLALDVSYWY